MVIAWAVIAIAGASLAVCMAGMAPAWHHLAVVCCMLPSKIKFN
jgi:hypothetical protein